MKTLRKKTPKSKPEVHPAIAQEFPERLSELEVELRLHATRKTADQPLKAIDEVLQAEIAGQPVLQFSLGKKKYAAGHADVTYSGSNHARGVRHIRYYVDGVMVFDIEGDFEDQQFGSNFRFKNMELFNGGDWEADFLKLSNDLRHHTEKRKLAFKKKRDAEQSRLHRHR